MSERDELARIVYEIEPWSSGTSYDAKPLLWSELDEDDQANYLPHADAILASGYRKPRTITTAEELDALPIGAIALDSAEWLFRKQIDFRYVAAGSGGLYSAAAIDFPATVLYEPSTT